MKFKNKSVIISGHRGNPACFTENTMKSFASAIATGVDMIETDIHLTKDMKLVLMHDDDISRTTNGSGKIKDFTLAQLKEFYVGDEAEEQRIPTFEEFLDAFADNKNISFNLEIKVGGNLDARVKFVVDKVVALCKEYGICDRGNINSFNFSVLRYFKDTYGDIMPRHGFYPYSVMYNVDIDPTPYLNYACFWVRGEEAKAACEFLTKNNIYPCTCETSKEEFFELINYGCAMFTVNNPKKYIEWLNNNEE